MAKKGLAANDETKKAKSKKQPKLINQLKDGLGWVSFNDYQMGQVGIKSDKHTTSELRNVVFDKLGIEAKRPKVEPTKKSS